MPSLLPQGTPEGIAEKFPETEALVLHSELYCDFDIGNGEKHPLDLYVAGSGGELYVTNSKGEVNAEKAYRIKVRNLFLEQPAGTEPPELILPESAFSSLQPKQMLDTSGGVRKTAWFGQFNYDLAKNISSTETASLLQALALRLNMLDKIAEHLEMTENRDGEASLQGFDIDTHIKAKEQLMESLEGYTASSPRRIRPAFHKPASIKERLSKGSASTQSSNKLENGINYMFDPERIYNLQEFVLK